MKFKKRHLLRHLNIKMQNQNRKERITIHSSIHLPTLAIPPTAKRLSVDNNSVFPKVQSNERFIVTPTDQDTIQLKTINKKKNKVVLEMNQMAKYYTPPIVENPIKKPIKKTIQKKTPDLVYPKINPSNNSNDSAVQQTLLTSKMWSRRQSTPMDDFELKLNVMKIMKDQNQLNNRFLSLEANDRLEKARHKFLAAKKYHFKTKQLAPIQLNKIQFSLL
jgi:hypothetical protein